MDESTDRPEYEPQPDVAAGPTLEPLPYRRRPADGPVPRMGGGGPSLVDEPPDPDSALGEGEVEDDERERQSPDPLRAHP